MRRFTVIMSAVLCFALLAGSAWAGGVVKFGVCETRSGAFKSNGDRILWGVQAALKEINDAGGLLGKKVELVVADNQMKGPIAVQKVKQMILKDKVEVIIQGSSSGVGGAIAQTMPRYRKIYLDTNAAAMGITGANFTPYTFRTCLNAGMHVKALAAYFAKKGLKKVFLINQDYSWGHDVAKYFELAIAKAAPGTKVVGKVFHKVFNKDFAPYISKIQASGADYVISGNWGTDLTQLIVQARQMGLNVPIGCAFLDDDAVMAIAREKAKGAVTANAYILGLDRPEARAMEDAYHKSSGGKWPSFVSYTAYMGVKMYAKAVTKAGSFDVEKIIKAFEGLSIAGPAGAMTMRPQDHQIQTPVVIGEYAAKTKYYSHPYLKPAAVIPAKEASLTPEESGWKPYKGK